MKVAVVVEVDTYLRRAISARRGRPGCANRKQVESFCQGHLEATLADIIAEHEQQEREADEHR